MVYVSKFIKGFGWPRIIIALFLLCMFIIGPFFGIHTDSSINNVIVRFGMNGVLVLCMVPMIQSGCGLNFGIPVGIIGGLLGATISLEFYSRGWVGIFVAILIACVFGAIFGFLYGMLLNKVKGDEMIIATYVGYFFVYFMNIMWLVLPYTNPASVLSFQGTGVRQQISLEGYWIHQMSNFLSFKINDHFTFPTGMILFFAIMCLIVWAFFKTKVGTAITAVGSNPEFARASGISVNRMRVIAVMASTIIASVGIIVYMQGYGFIQMYVSPLSFMYPSVAAILLGGASVNKSTITNVIIGTLLFQGIVTMAPSVINAATNTDASDIIRIVTSNGLILYALTRKGR